MTSARYRAWSLIILVFGIVIIIINSLEGSRAVALEEGISLPGDTWQWLEIFQIVILMTAAVLGTWLSS